MENYRKINLTNLELVELNRSELTNVEGGGIAYGIGYAVGLVSGLLAYALGFGLIIK